jgi:uncharacterized protein (TIGR02001 family)
MKKLIATALIVASGSAAAAEFSGNVTLTTDYRFRGISQGDRSPAIQGGFDLALDNGLYVGTWASNVTFSGAAIEIDYYAGFGGAINDATSYDVGFAYYNYPEDDADPDLDYYELYGSISFHDFTLGVNFSPDYFAETDTYWYVYGDYSFGLAENVSLDLHLGANLFADKDAGTAFGIGDAGGEDQYIDYSVGLSTSGMGLDFSLAYIGTDLDTDECFGGTKLCDDTVVLSVSKSL